MVGATEAMVSALRAADAPRLRWHKESPESQQDLCLDELFAIAGDLERLPVK
jgi:hypothetical protein